MGWFWPIGLLWGFLDMWAFSMGGFFVLWSFLPQLTWAKAKPCGWAKLTTLILTKSIYYIFKIL